MRAAPPPPPATVAGIYNHSVTETVVTFEEEPVAATEIA
jgi:L-amino acid N-acyltransferase YncA